MKIPTDLAGQRIKFLHIPPGWFEAAKEAEGLVEVVAPDGSALVLKPKGSLRNVMVEAGEIQTDSIEILVDKPRLLSAKNVSYTTLLSVRQHLLDRHGWTLLIVNETTDHAALKAHNEMTHVQLGHHHRGAQ